MITINVCIGSACHLKGSYNVINKLQALVEERGLGNEITIKGAFCLGECVKPVSVRVNEGAVYSVNEDKVEEFFQEVILGGM